MQQKQQTLNLNKIHFHDDKLNVMMQTFKNGPKLDKTLTLDQKLKKITQDRQHLFFKYDSFRIKEINEDTVKQFMKQQDDKFDQAKSINVIENIIQDHENRTLIDLKDQYFKLKKSQNTSKNNSKLTQTQNQIQQQQQQDQILKNNQKKESKLDSQEKEDDEKIHKIFQQFEQDIKINKNIKNLIYDYDNTFNIWDKDRIEKRLKKQWNDQFDTLIQHQNSKIGKELLKLEKEWNDPEDQKRLKRLIYKDIYDLGKKLNQIHLNTDKLNIDQDHSSFLQILRDIYDFEGAKQEEEITKQEEPSKEDQDKYNKLQNLIQMDLKK